jgi:hypothetical protein
LEHSHPFFQNKVGLQFCVWRVKASPQEQPELQTATVVRGSPAASNDVSRRSRTTAAQAVAGGAPRRRGAPRDGVEQRPYTIGRMVPSVLSYFVAFVDRMNLRFARQLNEDSRVSHHRSVLACGAHSQFMAQNQPLHASSPAFTQISSQIPTPWGSGDLWTEDPRAGRR